MYTSYEVREENLLELGFTSYADYLESDLWFLIRETILERDCYSCRKCGRQATNVHHFSYNKKSLSGASPHCLISVCRKCHERIEFKNGRKCSMKEVQQRTIRFILNTDMTPGRSNPTIGFWFRDQIKANKPIAKKIKQKIIELCQKSSQ